MVTNSPVDWQPVSEWWGVWAAKGEASGPAWELLEKHQLHWSCLWCNLVVAWPTTRLSALWLTAQPKAAKAKERFPLVSLVFDLLANRTVTALKCMPKLRRQWRSGSAGWHSRHSAELLELWARTGSRRPPDGAEAPRFQTVSACEMTTSSPVTLAYSIWLPPNSFAVCVSINGLTFGW